MAVRSHKSARRVLMPTTVNPIYRSVAHSIVRLQNIELVEIPFDIKTGITDFKALEKQAGSDFAALVIPQPNFFGALEEVDALTRWAHAQNALAIALVNPTSLALLEAPGNWGDHGADIAAGEGQPLGIPLSNGGPYLGFICCKQALVRQMPGRIIGGTVDMDGKRGFTLTLQAREQHIRRAKATSNICSNQGLAVTAATIYMSLVGADGLRRVAAQSHDNTRILIEMLCAIPGVQMAFSSPYFHEAVLQLPKPAAIVLNKMKAHGVIGGLDLAAHYSQLDHAMLVCVTETKTLDDLRHCADALRTALKLDRRNRD